MAGYSWQKRLYIWTLAVMGCLDISRKQRAWAASDHWSVTHAAVIERLFKNGTYNNLVRPGEDSDEVTPVTIDVMLNMISSISEMNMEFTTDLYFRQRWRDPRLAYNDFNDSLNLGFSRVSSVWHPDIFIPNLKGGYRHDLTTPNVLLRLDPDGTILYSQRLHLVVACIMDLQKFPLDQQKCRLDFMSYAYTVHEVTVTWERKANFSLNTKIKLPDFVIDGHSLGDCTEVFSTGTFGCVYVEVTFKRQFGYYFTSTYLPTLLVIVLSWVGFWIDYKSTPSRISLSLLTVLAVTTQSTGNLSELPRVSYIKSIDVWMAISMVFVAGSLLEFAIVNVIARRESERCKRKYRHRQTLTLFPEDIKRLSTASTQELVLNCEEGNYKQLTCPDRTSRQHNGNFKDESRTREAIGPDYSYALMIDKSSRVLFPLLFTLTCVVYGLAVHLNAYPEGGKEISTETLTL